MISLIFMVMIVIVGVVLYAAMSHSRKMEEAVTEISGRNHALEQRVETLDNLLETSVDCLRRIEQGNTDPVDDARSTLELIQISQTQSLLRKGK